MHLHTVVFILSTRFYKVFQPILYSLLFLFHAIWPLSAFHMHFVHFQFDYLNIEYDGIILVNVPPETSCITCSHLLFDINWVIVQLIDFLWCCESIRRALPHFYVIDLLLLLVRRRCRRRRCFYELVLWSKTAVQSLA